jgi:GGDEF domain-containing protein
MDTDRLTGLPTCWAFLQSLKSQRSGTLLYLNIASLVFSNAVLGPEATDRILVETAELLQTACPDGLVARVAGSGFVVFIERTQSDTLVQALRSAFDVRFAHRRASIRAGTSNAGVIDAPARVLTLRIGVGSLADHLDANSALVAAERLLS